MSQSDVEFLGALVRAERLGADRARELASRLGPGVRVEALVAAELDLEQAEVRELRRGGGRPLPEIPGYRLDGVLGEGGTATVYAARSIKTRQAVALKVLSAGAMANEQVRDGFVAELKLLRSLEHPNIVRAFTAARWQGTLIGVLEHVRGENLGERLAEGRPLPEDEALRVVLGVADALDHLASQGVVHRDVKPANVMLETDGRAVLIDLGFAGALDADGKGGPSETVAGTVAYLAPERARGAPGSDARSDVYALGCTLFHLVVGKLPFSASDDAEVLAMQIFQSLTSPELKGRGLSPHLHYFVEKMMAKDADDRYQSFAELANDVRAHLSGRSQLGVKRPAARTSSQSVRALRKRRKK